MRALASSLRGFGSSAGDLASTVAGDVAAMTFEGPAAGPFRDGIQAVRSAYEAVANELLDTASTLERAASEVERLQREREQRLAAMWDDYYAARRAAHRARDRRAMTQLAGGGGGRIVDRPGRAAPGRGSAAGRGRRLRTSSPRECAASVCRRCRRTSPRPCRPRSSSAGRGWRLRSPRSTPARRSCGSARSGPRSPTASKAART